MKKYIFNILISIDQLVNAIFLGDPDETISSRLGKWLDMDGWRSHAAKCLCYFLHLLDPDHCQKSVEQDEGNDALARGINSM